jgi:hypothetical protein
MKSRSFLFGLIFLMAGAIFISSCGGGGEQQATNESPETTIDPNDPMTNKGIGPVTSVTLGEFNPVMAEEGRAIYELKCVSCHKLNEKFVGPPPKGIMSRRSPEWIMNMILNPEEMVKKDPIARQLLIESNLAPMANQNLTEEEARKILEYFRTLE